MAVAVSFALQPLIQLLVLPLLRLVRFRRLLLLVWCLLGRFQRLAERLCLLALAALLWCLRVRRLRRTLRLRPLRHRFGGPRGLRRHRHWCLLPSNLQSNLITLPAHTTRTLSSYQTFPPYDLWLFHLALVCSMFVT